MSEHWIDLASGHRLWSRRIEGGPGLPLLLLHGGPGAGHDYLEPLAALAEDRPVIFYDQLGCGRSDRPDDPALWTIGRFADEVAEVRAALGLERCHILGQSWGGWLLVEYLLRRPPGVASAVLASTSASIPLFAAECRRLIGLMAPDHQRALAEHGARGDYAHPEYLAAVAAFYDRHLCRLPDTPDCLARTIANLDGNPVYLTINGPNEFTTIGNLRDWDRTADLHLIEAPVLITCGRHDELGPACAAPMQAGLRNARTVIFEHSAHVAHLEEPELYIATVAGFLRAHD